MRTHLSWSARVSRLIQYKGAHASVEGILRDIQKYNEAQLAGWKVMRVLPSELFTQSTIDLLKRAMPHAE